jgi:hypothetical protein
MHTAGSILPLALATALTVAACVPARSPSTEPAALPEYSPRVPVAPTPTNVAAEAPVSVASPLLGTTWSGIDSDGASYTYEFRAGGALHYTSPTGTFDNGTWKQTGDHVAWEMNGHYSDYEGTIRRTLIEGKARNKAGHTWTWSLEKQAPQ